MWLDCNQFLLVREAAPCIKTSRLTTFRPGAEYLGMSMLASKVIQNMRMALGRMPLVSSKLRPPQIDSSKRMRGGSEGLCHK